MSKTTPTPLFQAMLTAAGFTTEDEPWDTYAIEAKAAPASAETRALKGIVGALGDLESAERQLRRALDSFTDRVQREQSHLDSAYRVDTAWLAQSARDTADANAKVEAACEQIRAFAYIRNGKLGGQS